MAKVKGFNPPETELAYEDADGVLHYFGEFFRMVFREGSVSPRDPDTDITGKSMRGERPTQKGFSTPAQHPYREAFKNCTLLWNSLPEECPDPLPEDPVTAKESVWDAKCEHGVVCSYYNLFIRCCINWAMAHDGAMPDGDCFPCEGECIQDPAMAWDYDTSIEEIGSGGAGMVAVTGLNAPFKWSVSGTGFSLAHETTKGLTNTLDAADTACGSAEITVIGCDDRSVTGYVRGTPGRWIFISNTCEGLGVIANHEWQWSGGGGVCNSNYIIKGEKIIGDKKQTQDLRYAWYGTGASCPDDCPGMDCNHSGYEAEGKCLRYDTKAWCNCEVDGTWHHRLITIGLRYYKWVC